VDDVEDDVAPVPAGAEFAAMEELLELPPHAAIKAASPLAAAAAPIVLPAMRKNRLRSKSSRANSITAPSGRVSLLTSLIAVSFSYPG
jgi:hypothetical protein